MSSLNKPDCDITKQILTYDTHACLHIKKGSKQSFDLFKAELRQIFKYVTTMRVLRGKCETPCLSIPVDLIFELISGIDEDTRA